MQSSAHSLLDLPRLLELSTSEMELIIFFLNLPHPSIIYLLTNSIIIYTVTKPKIWEPFGTSSSRSTPRSKSLPFAPIISPKVCIAH